MMADFASDTKNFGRSVGPQGIRSNMEDLAKQFPDFLFEIIDSLAQGNDVVMRTKVSGTFLGTGKFGISPTGKHFEK